MPSAPALVYVTAFQMNAWDEGQTDDANPAQIRADTTDPKGIIYSKSSP